MWGGLGGSGISQSGLWGSPFLRGTKEFLKWASVAKCIWEGCTATQVSFWWSFSEPLISLCELFPRLGQLLVPARLAPRSVYVPAWLQPHCAGSNWEKQSYLQALIALSQDLPQGAGVGAKLVCLLLLGPHLFTRRQEGAPSRWKCRESHKDPVLPADEFGADLIWSSGSQGVRLPPLTPSLQDALPATQRPLGL